MRTSTQKLRSFCVIAFTLVFAGSIGNTAPAPASTNVPCQTPNFKRVNGLYLGSINRILVRKAHFADLNGDSKQDFVYLQLNPKTLYVQLGLGTGGFAAPVGYPVGTANSEPSDVKSGDVNGDGKRDLIVFSSGYPLPPFNNCASSISLLMGNGVGGFVTPLTYDVQLCNREVSVADFNSDGKSDVVFGSYSDNRIIVGLGDGTGSFAGTTLYDPGGVPSTWTVADFNGDNKPDLAVGTYDPVTFGNPKIVRFLNDGSGQLLPAVTVATVSGRLAAGDLNLDLKTDLVVNGPGNNMMTIMLGNGMGGFTNTSFAVPDTISENLTINDFSGDGKPDIARQGTILQGDGSGGFTPTNTFPPAGYYYFEAADLNGDGRTDLLAYGFNNLLTNTLGYAVFQSVCTPIKDTSRLDYDGDGKTDLAVWRPGTGQWVIRNSSNGSTRTEGWGLGSLNDQPAPGDYDGDGRTDLAVFRNNDSTWYILNSADSTFRAQFWGTIGDKPVAADYDGDGKTDIAVYRPSNGTWYALRSSDGSLYGAAWGTSGDKPVPEDYDGDDKADLAVFRPSSGFWYIYRSSDNGYDALAWGLSTDKPAQGDFDGDGKADLMVYRASTGHFWLRRSFDGSGFVVNVANLDATNQPVTGDFDGDGITDLVLRRTSDNIWMFRNSNSGLSNTAWGMTGDSQATSAYPIE